MHIIMGGSGHVGSAVAETLIARGEGVAIVTRDASHTNAWREKGVRILEADVNDVSSLRAAFRQGRRAFLLNPPADIKTDTDAVERRTVAGILAALDGSGLEKVVAESTAGAQAGECIGDLNVLWELEQGLLDQAIPAAINRAPYYMSNWDDQLDAIRKTGVLQTMYPADLKLPMAAPRDLGAIAADRLISAMEDIALRYLEGPERYSSADVAEAFAKALGRPVKVMVTPRSEWEETYRKLGFSVDAARSYARMTAVSLNGGFDFSGEPIRGETTLEQYIHALVARS
jgi:uncharacterized protein YbjT (DUF2867 family)